MKEKMDAGTQRDSVQIDSDEDSLSEGVDLETGVPGFMEKKGPDLASELEARNREIEALSDRFLRLQAEFENFKKRTAKERMELIKFANEGLLSEVVPVLDSLELAIASAKENANIEKLLEGLELVRRLFSVFLERAGVKEIRAQGQAFDPQLHEAISVLESGDHPDNTVVEEVQRGYLLNSRVLRPAMVKVAKSLPAEGTQSEGEES